MEKGGGLFPEHGVRGLRVLKHSVFPEHKAQVNFIIIMPTFLYTGDLRRPR